MVKPPDPSHRPSMIEITDRFVREVRELSEENLNYRDAANSPISSLNTAPQGILSEIAARIDHTLLKPEATQVEIEQVCTEARQHGFATVCVNSSWVSEVARLLQGSRSIPIAVVGFPLGEASTASKVFETRQAVMDGAREIDMVLARGRLRDRNYTYVMEDIRAVVEAARPWPVKVILETGALSDDEKIAACGLAKSAGAAFVKTSTGFGPGGASAADVALMRKIVGPEMGVKASGGIRTYEDAKRMIEAGASRLGCSASVAIVSRGNAETSSGSATY